mmetsp:Transcript_15935/g.24026  ORF Transcript_15935/g.24026 Transcript_15935/m.24026 type:complete len:182 (-) Transcript_15935:221-766(-)
MESSLLLKLTLAMFLSHSFAQDCSEGDMECYAEFQESFGGIIASRIKGRVEKKEDNGAIDVTIWNFRKNALKVFFVAENGDKFDSGEINTLDRYDTRTFGGHTFEFRQKADGEVLGNLTMEMDCLDYIIPPEENRELNADEKKLLTDVTEKMQTTCFEYHDPLRKWKVNLWKDRRIPPSES